MAAMLDNAQGMEAMRAGAQKAAMAANTTKTEKSAMDVSISPDRRKSSPIKRMEAMEGGWRMRGGTKSLWHKASGGSGGYFPSCGEKIIQGFARTSFEYGAVF
ncbi:MAG: hypothetical protein FWG12_07485 [Holophagaceae bacterium]|nr:hypothetical protein [Holophagaceae bacterium]